MTDYMEQFEGQKSRKWLKWLVAAVVLIGLIGAGAWYWQRGPQEAEQIVEELPSVTVKSLAEISTDSTIEKMVPIKPALTAPLVAKTGGMVTALAVSLGDQVSAGETVVEIDGANVASISRVQLASAQAGMAAFNQIEKQALASSSLAIETAWLSYEAAKAGRTLTAVQVSKSRQQADLAVEQARLAYQDAVESEQRSDVMVRSADIALKAAGMAQDQATIAKSLAARQTSDAVKQAEIGLAAARQGKERIAAELSSQRVALQGQLNIAREQWRMSQVITPIDGEVVRLKARVGDLVMPGEAVGEVLAQAGAVVSLEVPTSVRTKLNLGQTVQLERGAMEFTGQITQLAEGPAGGGSSWQVEIFINSTPEVVHAGDLVTVRLPVGATAEERLLPLDVVVFRQSGPVIYTVKDGRAEEHLIEIKEYAGELVAVKVALEPEAMLVVAGNRTLKSGQEVKVN